MDSLIKCKDTLPGCNSLAILGKLILEELQCIRQDMKNEIKELRLSVESERKKRSSSQNNQKTVANKTSQCHRNNVMNDKKCSSFLSDDIDRSVVSEPLSIPNVPNQIKCEYVVEEMPCSKYNEATSVNAATVFPVISDVNTEVINTSLSVAENNNSKNMIGDHVASDLLIPHQQNQGIKVVDLTQCSSLSDSDSVKSFETVTKSSHINALGKTINRAYSKSAKLHRQNNLFAVKSDSFQCRICNKRFSERKHISKHIHNHTSNKNFECHLCTEGFYKLSHLNQHTLTHTKNKKFVCRFCNKHFVTRQNLQVHIRVHTGEKPFCCPVCNRAFSQKSSMKTHWMRFHVNHDGSKYLLN